MNVIDKYGPQSLGDVIIPNLQIKNTLQHIAAGRLDSHLILHGPSGTGKSTIASMIVEQQQLNKSVEIETNYNKVLSQPNIWAFIATNLHSMQFLGNLPPKYIMCFDEFEMCKHAYEHFWNALDRFKKTDVMLMATTNNLHKLPAPLRSRCQVISIPSLTVQDFMSYATDVLNREGIQLQPTFVIGCLNVVQHLGDYRKYCDQLDQIILSHTMGEIPSKHYLQAKTSLQSIVTAPVIAGP